MKVLAFGASTSKNSINKKLATYASSLIPNAKVDIIDLNDYEMPLFSVDKEKEIGKPQKALELVEKFANTDMIIISFAEHNGAYPAAYKNIFDWCTRTEREVFQNKPMILLATSPGKGGANSVLSFAVDSVKYFAGKVVGQFSLPSFNENFDEKNLKISNSTLDDQLKEIVSKAI